MKPGHSEASETICLSAPSLTVIAQVVSTKCSTAPAAPRHRRYDHQTGGRSVGEEKRSRLGEASVASRNLHARNQPLLEILDQIQLVLETDRQSQQPVANSRGAAGLRAHARMGHADRMCHEAFYAAERFSQGEQLKPLEKLFNGRAPATQFEAEHR